MPIIKPQPLPTPVQIAAESALTSADIVASLPTDKAELLDALNMPTNSVCKSCKYIRRRRADRGTGRHLVLCRGWFSTRLTRDDLELLPHGRSGHDRNTRMGRGRQPDADDIIKHYLDGTQPVLNPPPDISPSPIDINPSPIEKLPPVGKVEQL